MEEIKVAAELLHAALERYISACQSFPSSFPQANLNRLSGIRQELSDHVSNELQSFESYETKLKKAKIALKQARNAVLVPIDALPDEILTRIFHLVLCSQPCSTTRTTKGSNKLLPQMYPDVLSHVCSRWRRVAVGSCTLWTHIDLAPCHPLSEDFLERAEVFASRADDLPLHIHVLALDFEYEFEDTRPEHENFLDSISMDLISLELVVGDTSNAIDGTDHINILGSFLECCEPGTLVQLNIMNNASGALTFIEATETHYRSELFESYGSLLLSLPYEFLESLWHSITTLRLYGLYPRWKSKAYHNLVELHLISKGSLALTISELQLTSILRSSPRLRVLHFDLVVTNPAPADDAIEPVRLDNLEELSLDLKDHNQLGSFLRWLAPGSLPIQLSLMIHPFGVAQFLANTEFSQFSARSNIAEFRLVNGRATYPQISELLRLLPNLLVLAIESSSLQNAHEDSDVETSQSPSHIDPSRPPAALPCLARLYLLSSGCELDGLRWLIGQCQAQALTLWSCRVAQDRGDVCIHDLQVVKRALSDACPVVEVMDSSKPNPTEIESAFFPHMSWRSH